MDNQTKLTLERANETTREIYIQSDQTLTVQDMEAIGKTLGRCPKVEFLALQHCAMADNSCYLELQALVDPVSKHPALSGLSLQGSSHHFFDSIEKMMVRNKRMRRLDLNGRYSYDKVSYTSFLKAAAATGNLTYLVLRDHPMNALDTSTFNELFTTDHFVNLFNIQWTGKEKGRTLPVYELENIINKKQDLFSQNKKRSSRILKALQENTPLDKVEKDLISRILPSLFHLAGEFAEQQALYKTLDALAKNEGLSFGLEIYEALYEGLDALVPVQKEIKSLPVLADIRKTLKGYEREALRQEILAARARPQDLMELGSEQIDVPRQEASLAVMGAMLPSVQGTQAARSIADFLRLFGEAKEVVSGFAREAKQPSKPALRAQENEAKPAIFRALGRLAFWNNSFETEAQKIYTRADACEKAKEAGTILQEMSDSIEAMCAVTATRMEEMGLALEIYDHIDRQVGLVCEVGGEILQEWRAEAKEVAEPIHVRALASRLSLVEQIGMQTGAMAAQHSFDLEVDQKQLEGLTVVKSQALPTLSEHVSAFMRQAGELQTASVIDSLAHATREAVRTGPDVSALAALETGRAIENLAQSLSEALQTVTQPAQKKAALPTSQEKPLSHALRFDARGQALPLSKADVD